MVPRDAEIIVRRTGITDYEDAWRQMRDFTAQRSAGTLDQLWLLQHPPVYTLGLKARDRVVSNPAGIPVIHTDRGGDITYHGPGQLVAYVLMDLRRRGWGIRRLVNALEQGVIDLLAAHGVAATRRLGAPGVYVQGRKIAALGLRVRGGRTYHGLSLNVAMDLTPFRHIAPCGYPGLEATQLADLGIGMDIARTEGLLTHALVRQLGYNHVTSLTVTAEHARQFERVL